MKQLTLQVPRTAHYTQLGEFTEATQTVWLACHGQGQLAANFAASFNELDVTTNVIIAPEALSKYYVKGYTGKVGACWMTKEHRLDEIQDYITYLDLVYWKIKMESLAPFRLNVLGFSQGAATVSRWITASDTPCNKLILWAGLFPEDVAEVDKLKSNVNTIYFVYGDQDEFVTPTHITAQQELLKNTGVPYRLVPFKGTHELNSRVLQDLAGQGAG